MSSVTSITIFMISDAQGLLINVISKRDDNSASSLMPRLQLSFGQSVNLQETQIRNYSQIADAGEIKTARALLQHRPQ